MKFTVVHSDDPFEPPLCWTSTSDHSRHPPSMCYCRLFVHMVSIGLREYAALLLFLCLWLSEYGIKQLACAWGDCPGQSDMGHVWGRYSALSAGAIVAYGFEYSYLSDMCCSVCVIRMDMWQSLGLSHVWLCLRYLYGHVAISGAMVIPL